MPLFIIERNYAEVVEVDASRVKAIMEINEDCGVKWLTSFLSADKRKSYCLYEASNPEDLREAARRANVPVDAITELSGEIDPAAFV